LKRMAAGFGLKTTQMEEVQLLRSYYQSKNHVKSSSSAYYSRERGYYCSLCNGRTTNGNPPDLKIRDDWESLRMDRVGFEQASSH
jgi:hypothetical protein